MKIRAFLPLVLMFGCTAEEAKEFFLDTYIVALDAKPAEVVQTVTNIQEAFDIEPLHIFQQATQGFQVKLPVGLDEEIKKLDEVKYIIIDNPEDFTPPTDDYAPEFGDSEVPEGVSRINGPATNNLSGIEVAVVDTGVDLDHPDLNVVAGVDIIGNGDGDDEQGHGTHVAGTIGAIGDGNGVVGVAPGVGIHAVRVLDANGSGTYGDVIAGLEYVLEHPEIRVVNLSLGGAGDPTASNAPLREAIETLSESGVVVCIAAGNDGANTSGIIPAGYDKGIIVSAYDADGGDNGFAYFSNFGDAVDISAPGVNITSTYLNGDYAALSGTSMATPHVAGAAAAYVAKNPSASAADVLDAILSTAEDNINGQNGNHPEGLIDVEALVD